MLLHLDVFDPFARVAAIVLARVKEDFSITFFDGNEELLTRTYGKNDPFDKDIKTSLSQREQVMRSESFRAEVKCLNLSFEVVVRNCLVTSEYPITREFSKYYNADEGFFRGELARVYFREAEKTIGGNPSFVVADSAPRWSYVRSLYQYVVRRVYDDVIYIDGPSPEFLDKPDVKFVKVYGYLAVGSYKYSLCIETDVEQEVIVSETLDEEVVVADDKRYTVYLHGDFGEKRFFLSQTYGYSNNVVLDAESVLMIIKMVVALERDTFKTEFKIPVNHLEKRVDLNVVRKGSTYALEASQLFEIIAKTENSENLRDIDRLKIFDKSLGIMLNTGSYAVVIDTSRAASCFALSLATYLARRIGRPEMGVILSILISCVDHGVFEVNSKHLIGRTASGETFNFFARIDGIDVPFKFSRSTYSARQYDSVPDGLILFGFDPRENDVSKGEPDHWIVAVKDDGLRAIYDSYGVDPVPAGRDLMNVVLSGRDVLLCDFKVLNYSQAVVKEDFTIA